MKSAILMLPLLLSLATVSNAINIIPATEAHQGEVNQNNQALERYLQRIDIAIKDAVSDGRSFTYVDLYGSSWEQEKQCIAVLKSQGYKVDIVGGIEGINSALKIRW